MRALAPSSPSTRPPETYTPCAVWTARRSHTTRYEPRLWIATPTGRWNQSQNLSSRCRTSTTMSQSSWRARTRPACPRCHLWVSEVLALVGLNGFMKLVKTTIQFSWILFMRLICKILVRLPVMAGTGVGMGWSCRIAVYMNSYKLATP